MSGEQSSRGARHLNRARPASEIVNALSFDIEDWFHLIGIDAISDSDSWAGLPSVVERRTDEILSICDAFSVSGTFFVLGWIAERYPTLVRRIADAGHELGTHSYWHRRVNDLDEETFREDLGRSIDVIEGATGCRVTSFRAPSFSITPGTEWAFDVLLDAGLDYDASLYPVARQNGGYPCPRQPHIFVATPSGRPVVELPMSLMDIGPATIGFSGGGYLRALPGWLIRRGFDGLHANGIPGVVYLHPRDFAPDCPRIAMPFNRRLRTYVGLGTTGVKLRMLLSTYRFASCGDVLSARGSADKPPGKAG